MCFWREYIFLLKLNIFEITQSLLSHDVLPSKNINFFLNRVPLLKTVILPFTFLPDFECIIDDNFFTFLSIGNLIKKFLNLIEELVGLYFLKKILFIILLTLQ